MYWLWLRSVTFAVPMSKTLPPMVPIRFQIMLTSDYWDCDAMLGGDAMRYAIIVPAGVNTDQVLDVLVNNLRNHPEKRHEASRVLIAWALQKAFPCR